MTGTTTTTAKPFDFGIENDRADRYGSRFWMIGLPDGREMSCHADTVEVLPSGALLTSGRFRRVDEHGMSVEGTFRDMEPTVFLAPGCWTHAYAASGLDGSPVAVQHVPEPERANGRTPSAR